MNAFARTPPTERVAERPPRGGHAPHGRIGLVQLCLGIVAAIAALVLVVTGALNRSLQAEVAKGQAKIANAQTAANVNTNLIRLLAKAAAEKNDGRIRDLLARNGITYAAAPAAPATGPEARP